ncbi:MAG: LVIVD repeat-containing protein [Candidatus Odinarchaeota archaeon]
MMKKTGNIVIGIILLALLLNTFMINTPGKSKSSSEEQPFHFSEVGQISAEQPVFGLEVIDKKAYFIEKDRGFIIYDVSDPSSCVELDEYLLSYPHDLSVEGDRAVVIDPQVGVVILDISDSSDIKELGIFSDITDATHIYVAGDRVYIGDEGNGLKIVDISDPASSVLLGTWKDTEGGVGDVYVIEDHVFVGLQLPRVNAPPLSLGLKVLDASDPVNITVASTVGSGDEYLSFAPSDHVGSFVYLADAENGFKILDFTDPGNVTCIGSYSNGETIVDFEIVGNYSFAVDSGKGFVVIDVSDPSGPFKVASYEHPSLVINIDVVGEMVYLGTVNSGIRIISRTEESGAVPEFELFVVIIVLVSIPLIVWKKGRKNP